MWFVFISFKLPSWQNMHKLKASAHVKLWWIAFYWNLWIALWFETMNPLNAFRNYSGIKVLFSPRHHHQRVTFFKTDTHTHAHSLPYIHNHTFKFTEDDKYSVEFFNFVLDGCLIFRHKLCCKYTEYMAISEYRHYIF